jgi:hypothetical protein
MELKELLAKIKERPAKEHPLMKKLREQNPDVAEKIKNLFHKEETK